MKMILISNKKIGYTQFRKDLSQFLSEKVILYLSAAWAKPFCLFQQAFHFDSLHCCQNEGEGLAKGALRLKNRRIRSHYVIFKSNYDFFEITQHNVKQTYFVNKLFVSLYLSCKGKFVLENRDHK